MNSITVGVGANDRGLDECSKGKFGLVACGDLIVRALYFSGFDTHYLKCRLQVASRYLLLTVAYGMFGVGVAGQQC